MYIPDSLYTLITGRLDDPEGGVVASGGAEGGIVPCDLSDFLPGKVRPCILGPNKEPCMQTAIADRHRKRLFAMKRNKLDREYLYYIDYVVIVVID